MLLSRRPGQQGLLRPELQKLLMMLALTQLTQHFPVRAHARDAVEFIASIVSDNDGSKSRFQCS